jgi:hypothetical protein
LQRRGYRIPPEIPMTERHRDLCVSWFHRKMRLGFAGDKAPPARCARPVSV